MIKRLIASGALAVLSLSSLAFGAVPADDVFLVSVGHGPGACVQGVCSQWRSDLWTRNPSSSTATVVVAFLPRDSQNLAPATFTYDLAPGETAEFVDVIQSRFGLDNAFGALRVTADRSIEVTGRIYDENVQTAKGTGSAGQLFAGLPAAMATGSAEPAWLIGVAQDAGGTVRSNFGFVETTGNPVKVLVEQIAANGAVAAAKSYLVREYEARQFNIADLGGPTGTNQRLRIRVLEGIGRVLVFASRIDNRSGDPSTVLPVLAARDVYLASVGHGQGTCVQGICSQWRSDLWASNPWSGESATVQVYFLRRDTDNSAPPSFSFSLDPGEAVAIPDVVMSRFGLGSAFGALRAVSDVPIHLTGRIYDENVQTAKGTGSAGQFFASTPAAAGIGMGDEAHLIGLAQDGGGLVRSNFGFVEVTGNPATVEVERISAAGQVLASKSFSVRAREARQFNIGDLGGQAGTNQRLRMRVTAGAGRVIGFGSRIDNSSGDPSTVEATVVIPFAPTGNATLGGGLHVFSSFSVPSGVTVTVAGDAEVLVTGDVGVAGSVVGDCVDFLLHSYGDVSVTGGIDVSCVTPPALAAAALGEPGDLRIVTSGGTLAVGTADTAATLDTDGELDVGNDPTTAEWEYDVLPSERSSTPVPPICAIQADTLVSTVDDGSPAEVAFLADAADPDGGPVSYAWLFGDGGSSSEAEPVHAYASAGAFQVQLTVTDDEGASASATLWLVIGAAGADPADRPAVGVDAADVVIPVGQATLFSADAADPQGGGLTYLWSFSDGGASSEAEFSHSFASAGIVDGMVTVTDEASNSSTASFSVWVFEPAAGGQWAGLFARQGDCLTPGPNVFNSVRDGGKAPMERNGKDQKWRGRGNIVLGGGTDLKAQDGGDGRDRNGTGTQRGGRGRRGGSLKVLVAGHLTVCGGAVFENGSGGRGGDATSDTPAPGRAVAIGGNGGRAGKRLLITATGGIDFEASPFGDSVTVRPGNGGRGGDATATGGDGMAMCPVGKDGADATAEGGNGGAASKLARVSGAVTGLFNVDVEGGMGGRGGTATAVPGNGGTATCVGTATGGDGGDGKATGGKGGDAKLSGAGGTNLAADAFTAGDGGDADANFATSKGDGGDATATPPGACAAATATGGDGGQARALGGRGGTGRFGGDGGDGDAFGGFGGAGTATGGNCVACAAGGDASARGGDGGTSSARYGRGAAAGGNDGTATSLGGNGGPSEATGGRGGDCATCPAGAGGPGGSAGATGGRGGNALGNDVRLGGDGGKGDGNGGAGGNGADCCAPDPAAGGAGGQGGVATSTAGQPGTPGGSVGDNATRGGAGGAGGDGAPPGAGGPGGAGNGNPVDIPDGPPGAPGAPCPTTSIIIIDHSGLALGPIEPGTVTGLPLIPLGSTGSLGTVPADFADAEEFGGEVGYAKQPGQVVVQRGGIAYDFQNTPQGTQPIQVELVALNLCGSPGCIALVGAYQGQIVQTVQSPAGEGEQQLVLPPPPGTVPYYDVIFVLGQGSFSFGDNDLKYLNGSSPST